MKMFSLKNLKKQREQELLSDRVGKCIFSSFDTKIDEIFTH
jgi:hypothetical protein